MTLQYAVVLHPADEGGYWSEVPTLPGCASQGETLEQALENTRTAIREWLDYLREKGEAVPQSGDIVMTIDVAA